MRNLWRDLWTPLLGPLWNFDAIRPVAPVSGDFWVTDTADTLVTDGGDNLVFNIT